MSQAEWKAATIAAGATSSSAIDLGRDFDALTLQIPPMDSCKLYLQVAEREGGTYYDLGKDTTTEEESFNRADSWDLFGFRFIRVVSTRTQTAERLIRVRGIKEV